MAGDCRTPGRTSAGGEYAYLAASHSLLPSASADPQGSKRRDGLGSSVVSPCYAVTCGEVSYRVRRSWRFLQWTVCFLRVSCCGSHYLLPRRCGDVARSRFVTPLRVQVAMFWLRGIGISMVPIVPYRFPLPTFPVGIFLCPSLSLWNCAVEAGSFVVLGRIIRECTADISFRSWISPPQRAGESCSLTCFCRCCRRQDQVRSLSASTRTTTIVMSSCREMVPLHAASVRLFVHFNVGAKMFTPGQSISRQRTSWLSPFF